MYVYRYICDGNYMKIYVIVYSRQTTNESKIDYFSPRLQSSVHSTPTCEVTQNCIAQESPTQISAGIR